MGNKKLINLTYPRITEKICYNYLISMSSVKEIIKTDTQEVRRCKQGDFLHIETYQ